MAETGGNDARAADDEARAEILAKARTLFFMGVVVGLLPIIFQLVIWWALQEGVVKTQKPIGGLLQQQWLPNALFLGVAVGASTIFKALFTDFRLTIGNKTVVGLMVIGLMFLGLSIGLIRLSEGDYTPIVDIDQWCGHLHYCLVWLYDRCGSEHRRELNDAYGRGRRRE